MRCSRWLGVSLFVGALVASSGCGSDVRVGGAGGADAGDAGSGGKGLGGSACRGDDDCPSDQVCFAPGDDPGCGICSPSDMPCATDADCQAMGDHLFCDMSDSCICDGLCKAGCAVDADCGGGRVCMSDHTCLAGCQADADCGANLACSPTDKPHCAPAACSSDADCAGFCVDGQCFDTPGTCMNLAD